jgi:hypothetical protein
MIKPTLTDEKTRLSYDWLDITNKKKG